VSKRRGLPETSRMRHDSHFVEQLVRADELPIGRKLAVHLLEANPDQPRTILGDLADLTRSIAEKGVLEPILVRPREDGRFTIIAGERRFRAAMDAGLTEVPCIEMDVSDRELLEIALVENLQRKDLTPFEEADGFLALQQKYSYTHEQIAKAVGKSRVTITETMALGKLSDRVRDECRRADMPSKSFLLELTRLPGEPEMLAALQAYNAGKLTSRDTLRTSKKDSASEPLPRAYSFDYRPENAPFKISVAFHGTADREQIVEAIRDLGRRIGVGEIDLGSGRFASPKKK